MPILNCLTYTSKEGGGAADDYSSWFGTGEDGDLTVSSDVALPVALDSGQIIKQYNNLTVTSTGVLHPANRCNGMILLVKGDLTVDGTIHVDKCAPLLNDNEELAAQEKHVALCGELMGGKGGDGGRGDAAGSSGAKNGGTGGAGFRFGGGLGAGGGGISGGTYVSSVTSYSGASGDPRPPIGTPVPFAASRNNSAQYGAGGSTSRRDGGGGPGGSGAAYYRRSSGSEYDAAGIAGSAFGGGLLCIFVGGKVRINSTARVSSAGGAGANAVDADSASSGPGGGGGGGIICIVHTGDSVIGGAISSNGGSAGSLGDRGGTDAQDGSSGTVLITNIFDLLGEGGDEYEWATISTVSGMAPSSSTGLYCVTSENGYPIAIELSGQQQIPILIGSYFRDDASWTVGESYSDVELIEQHLYLVKGDVFLNYMGPS